MRESLSPSQSLLAFVCGEPLAWLVVGIGAVVGYVAQAVAVLFIAWAVLVPAGLAWLYLSQLRLASFLCSGCGKVSGYAEARSAARKWQAPVSGG